MKKPLLLGLFYIILLEAAVFSQEQSEPKMEELLKEALSVNIKASIIHDMQTVMWQSEVEKLTIPGRPVTIHMNNEQARLSVHFTPYKQMQGGLILVAQSEIWLVEAKDAETSPENLRYFTSMNSVALEYGEVIFFYPLGKMEKLDIPDQIQIEMALSISPYDYKDETLAAEKEAEGES